MDNLVDLENVDLPASFDDFSNPVQFDEQGFAQNNGTVTVYNINPLTGEYRGSSEDVIVKGTGVPAGSYLDVPPAAKEGYVICRDQAGWTHQVDHRGQTAYHKNTQQETTITELGEVDDDYTLLPPSGPFDRFDNGKWVPDMHAEQEEKIRMNASKKSSLMSNADKQITLLQDAIDLDMVEAGDKEKYDAWRKYRLLLSRVDINQAPTIKWPTKPA